MKVRIIASLVETVTVKIRELAWLIAANFISCSWPRTLFARIDSTTNTLALTKTLGLMLLLYLMNTNKRNGKLCSVCHPNPIQTSCIPSNYANSVILNTSSLFYVRIVRIAHSSQINCVEKLEGEFRVVNGDDAIANHLEVDLNGGR